MTRGRLSRLFWIGAAAILVVAALVALTAVLRGSFSDTDTRVLGTLGALLYCGGALLAGLALVERGRARVLGLAVAAAAPVVFAVMLLWIWTWVDEDGDEDHWRLAWTGILVLLAGLVAATALLLARRHVIEPLAVAAGVLAAVATGLTLVAIWHDDPGSAVGKAIAASWILAVLAWALVPVLQRFSAVGTAVQEVRVLATLDDVELVATRGPVDGVLVEGRPANGERLALRRRR